jgi:hypothetical protein
MGDGRTVPQARYIWGEMESVRDPLARAGVYAMSARPFGQHLVHHLGGLPYGPHWGVQLVRVRNTLYSIVAQLDGVTVSRAQWSGCVDLVNGLSGAVARLETSALLDLPTSQERAMVVEVLVLMMPIMEGVKSRGLLE